MGRKNELHAFVAVEIGNDYVLIGFPRTSNHEYVFRIPGKFSYDLVFFGGIPYVGYTIKASIARNRYVFYAFSLEQAAGIIILHKESRKCSKLCYLRSRNDEVRQ